MDTHTDLPGARVGNSNILQAEYVEGLAVGFETKCFHRDRLVIGHRVLRLVWLAKSSCGSTRG